QPQPPQPQPQPPKRLKTFPTKTQSFPSVPTNSSSSNQLPITMPMPLPYTAAKVAPIPMIGANVVQIKKESVVNAPVPSLSPTLPPPPPTNGSTTDEASPKLIESAPTMSTMMATQPNGTDVEPKLETAAS